MRRPLTRCTASARQSLVEAGDRWGEAELLRQRARVETETDRFAAAIEHLEAAAELFATIGDLSHHALTLGAIAYTKGSLGDLAGARTAYDRAVSAFEATDEHAAHGAALLGLAEIQIAKGELTAARIGLQRALRLLGEHADGVGEEIRELLRMIDDALHGRME